MILISFSDWKKSSVWTFVCVEPDQYTVSYKSHLIQVYFGYWNRLSPYIVPDSDASCMWVVFYVGWLVRTCVDSTNIRPLLLFIHQSCRHRSKERKKRRIFLEKWWLVLFFIESISQRKYSKTEQLLINILSRRYIILSSRL